MPVTVSNSDGKKHSASKGRLADPEKAAELKEKFLQAYRAKGTIWAACDVIGVHRTTIQEWRNNDPGFLLAFQACDEEQGDRIESLALEMANEKKDGRLVWNMLQALKREKYNVPRNHTVTGPNGSAINVGFVDVDSMKAQLIALCHQFPTIAPKVRENIQAILDAIPK